VRGSSWFQNLTAMACPLPVISAGNPAHLNFGKGLGKVGFFSGVECIPCILAGHVEAFPAR
jgi:hypothetical protein